MARFSSEAMGPASSMGRPAASMMCDPGCRIAGTEIGAPVRAHLHTAAQPSLEPSAMVRRTAVAQLLLHFQRQALLGERGTLVDQGEALRGSWACYRGELNIHHGADALNDGSVAHVDSLLDSFCRSTAGLLRQHPPDFREFLW